MKGAAPAAATVPPADPAVVAATRLTGTGLHSKAGARRAGADLAREIAARR